jgi:lysyl-tRNA synthetase class 2
MPSRALRGPALACLMLGSLCLRQLSRNFAGVAPKQLGAVGRAQGVLLRRAKGAAAAVQEEVDPTAYLENRKRQLRELGDEAYPHEWPVTHSAEDLIEKYDGLADGEMVEGMEIRIAGRVKGKRASGNKLIFYDLSSNGNSIQLMCTLGDHEGDNFKEVHGLINRGDIIGVRGLVGKSKRGQLSVFPREVKLLSPCLHMLPTDYQGLKDQETRYRKRYLDLIVNGDVRKTFVMRSQVINSIRQYLVQRNFIEVETPMMNSIAGGATARPFVTYLNEMKMDLTMRIAPELYLKQLVIGGMDRVFEIGRNFRNEGIDLTHNPEFTSCEFYMAYADYNTLMDMTEELFSSMVLAIKGSYVFDYHPDGPDGKAVTVDFTPPWNRISMVEEIEKKAGVTLNRDFETEAGLQQLDDLARSLGVECASPRTAPRLLDKLCGHFIEDSIVNPTFIVEHPQVMSPLAKWHRSKPGLTERFELFVNGKELANAYTELNDPGRQLAFFEQQAADKAAGDDEAQPTDYNFVTALEHGLPPTGGWGCGVDRLVMLLADKNNIKEVILFPMMKPE